MTQTDLHQHNQTHSGVRRSAVPGLTPGALCLTAEMTSGGITTTVPASPESTST
jgi:hypothetical protein